MRNLIPSLFARGRTVLGFVFGVALALARFVITRIRQLRDV